MEKIRLSRAEI